MKNEREREVEKVKKQQRVNQVAYIIKIKTKEAVEISFLCTVVCQYLLIAKLEGN